MTNGFVSTITAKPWNGKTLYSFRLANDDTWYNCGETDPVIGRGDRIEFEAVPKGNGRASVKAAGIKIVAEGKTEIHNGKNGTPSYVDHKEKYWNDRAARDVEVQKVIQLQSARNSAIELTTLLFANGAIDMSKVKPAGKKQVIMDQVNELIELFQSQSAGVSVPGNEVEATVETTTDDEDSWSDA